MGKESKMHRCEKYILLHTYKYTLHIAPASMNLGRGRANTTKYQYLSCFIHCLFEHMKWMAVMSIVERTLELLLK